MNINQSLNLSALVTIQIQENIIPLVRLTAMVNAEGNSYSISVQTLNKEQVENNQTYVAEQVALFKTTVQKRASELSITYFV